MMIGTILLAALQASPAPAQPSDNPSRARTITDPQTWVTPSDYPALAMREKREGATGFLLTIGPDGVPQKCEILSSSGHADLDAKACQLLARFTPATDAKGKAVIGSYASRVRWQIPDVPDTAPNLIVAGTQILRFTLSESGDLRDCEVINVDGSSNTVMASAMCGGGRMVPFRDEAGRDVARRVTITSSAKIEPVSVSVTPPAAAAKPEQ
jgi:TonB family protein